MDYLINPFRMYFTFRGRSSRKEYWIFMAWLFLISIFCRIIAPISDGCAILATVLTLITIIPAISISVRRYHDADYSGWWYWCPIMNLVILFFRGTPCSNTYGEPS